MVGGANLTKGRIDSEEVPWESEIVWMSVACHSCCNFSVARMGIMPKLRELDLLNSPVYPISPTTVERWCPSMGPKAWGVEIVGDSV